MNKSMKETRLANLRSEEVDDKMILEGYAIIFEEETLIGDEKYGFREVIDKEALKNTIMKDVPLKYNHMDNFLVIARTKNGSLKLEPDERGLKIKAELLDTSSNEDIYKMVRSGLLDKMSFAFTVKEQVWDKSGDVPLRRIKSIDRLFDVSIVDLPAYEGTSVYSRSLEIAEASLKAMEVEEKKRLTELKKKRIQIKIKIGGN